MKAVTKSTKLISKTLLAFFLLAMALPAMAQRSPEILQGEAATRVAPHSELVRMNLLTQTPSFVQFEEAKAPSNRSSR